MKEKAHINVGITIVKGKAHISVAIKLVCLDKMNLLTLNLDIDSSGEWVSQFVISFFC